MFIQWTRTSAHRLLRLKEEESQRPLKEKNCSFLSSVEIDVPCLQLPIHVTMGKHLKYWTYFMKNGDYFMPFLHLSFS
jgi:hypothetical protein